MTGATAPRLQLELICARILLPAASGEQGYAARLDRLERRLDVGGVPSAARGSGPAAPPAGGMASTPAPGGGPGAPAPPSATRRRRSRPPAAPCPTTPRRPRELPPLRGRALRRARHTQPAAWAGAANVTSPTPSARAGQGLPEPVPRLPACRRRWLAGDGGRRRRCGSGRCRRARGDRARRVRRWSVRRRDGRRRSR